VLSNPKSPLVREAQVGAAWAVFKLNPTALVDPVEAESFPATPRVEEIKPAPVTSRATVGLLVPPILVFPAKIL